LAQVKGFRCRSLDLFDLPHPDDSDLAFAMDFFRSAVASAIASGPPFPYSFGDIVDIDESIWTLHNGTKKVRARRKTQRREFMC
jgi:SCY1-like protein 1